MHLHEPIPGWRNGIDPIAAGLEIRKIGRAHHRLGDALRLELAEPALEAPTEVHLQWFIATGMGPWAMWTTCRPDEVARREEDLQAVTWTGLGDGETVAGEPLAVVR